MLRCHALQPSPYRKRPSLCDLGCHSALSGPQGIQGALYPELHGCGRQDHPCREAGRGAVERYLRPLHQVVLRVYGCPQCAPCRPVSAGFGDDSGYHQDDRDTGGEGLCLSPGKRGCVLQRGEICGIWKAQRPKAGGHAGRCPRRGGWAQASSHGLCPLEVGKARRALLGKPLGAGKAGLAYRVLRHVPEIPRGDI